MERSTGLQKGTEIVLKSLARNASSSQEPQSRKVTLTDGINLPLEVALLPEVDVFQSLAYPSGVVPFTIHAMLTRKDDPAFREIMHLTFAPDEEGWPEDYRIKGNFKNEETIDERSSSDPWTGVTSIDGYLLSEGGRVPVHLKQQLLGTTIFTQGEAGEMPVNQRSTYDFGSGVIRVSGVIGDTSYEHNLYVAEDGVYLDGQFGGEGDQGYYHESSDGTITIMREIGDLRVYERAVLPPEPPPEEPPPEEPPGDPSKAFRKPGLRFGHEMKASCPAC